MASFGSTPVSGSAECNLETWLRIYKALKTNGCSHVAALSQPDDSLAKKLALKGDDDGAEDDDSSTATVFVKWIRCP